MTSKNARKNRSLETISNNLVGYILDNPEAVIFTRDIRQAFDIDSQQAQRVKDLTKAAFAFRGYVWAFDFDNWDGFKLATDSVECKRLLSGEARHVSCLNRGLRHGVLAVKVAGFVTDASYERVRSEIYNTSQSIENLPNILEWVKPSN